MKWGTSSTELDTIIGTTKKGPVVFEVLTSFPAAICQRCEKTSQGTVPQQNTNTGPNGPIIYQCHGPRFLVELRYRSLKKVHAHVLFVVFQAFILGLYACWE